MNIIRIACVLFLYVASVSTVSAERYMAGDLAPRSGTDGVLNVADILILQQIVSGKIQPTAEEVLVSDLAPYGNPDGQINVADVLILQRAVFGLVELSPITILPPPPVLDGAVTPTSENPYLLTGVATAFSSVNIYVNDVFQGSTTALIDGTFSYEAVLQVGANSVYATELDSVDESNPSNILAIDHQLNDGGVLAGIDNVVLAPNTRYTINSGTNTTVNVGNTLTIERGARLEFEAGTSALDINGAIVVNGRKDIPVLFTSSSPTPAARDWQGIWISDATGATRIDFAQVEYALYAINFEQDSRGTVSNTTIRNSEHGIRVLTASSPFIGPGNVISGNDYGVSVYGNNNILENPTPVVQGNSIQANSLNFYTRNFGEPDTTVLDANRNWWGSTDFKVIHDKIYDKESPGYSSYGSPWVDTGIILAEENGADHPVKLLRLPVYETATLLSGSEYFLLNTVDVSGAGLLIEAGVTIRSIDGRLEVEADGYLEMAGTSQNNVIFTSANDPINAAPNDWQGIEIKSASDLNRIDYADIQFARDGLFFSTGAKGQVSNTKLQNNSNGVRIWSQTAVDIGPGNVITDNLDGIRISGDRDELNNPVVVINGNSIYGNTSRNLYTNSFGNNAYTVIDATLNWWGETDFTMIHDRIYDYRDNGSTNRSPWVNIGNVLDANGDPLPGNLLHGPFVADTTLSGSNVFQVVEKITVLPGVVLTVEPGAKLLFDQGAFIQVDGTLLVNGDASNRVVLTSTDPVKSRGSWGGVKFRSTSMGSIIRGADIQWAGYAIDINSAVVTIDDNLISNYQSYGIVSRSAPGGIISNNIFNNLNKTGTAIWLDNSILDISGNTIENNATGIYLKDGSNSQITGNFIIDNGGDGIYVTSSSPSIIDNVIAYNTTGINIRASNPNQILTQPVITGNDIYANTSRALVLSGYYDSGIVLDVTGNWWGNDVPDFASIIRFINTPDTTVNTSGYLSSAKAAPAIGQFAVSNPVFSPDNDGSQDTTDFTATFSTAINWNITILKNQATVRTYTGSGTSLMQTWDGKDAGGSTAPDGIYQVKLTATDPAGGLSSVRYITVAIDLISQQAIITSPVENATVLDSVSIQGRVGKDGVFTTYYLSVGAGTSPSVFTRFASGTVAGAYEGVLGEWQTNSFGDEIIQPNGIYTIKLRSEDASGAFSERLVTVNLGNLLIYNASHDRTVFDPIQGEQTVISFTTNQEANITVRLVPEISPLKRYPDITTETDVVRTFNLGVRSAGTHTVSWDGRDDAGDYVAEEGYLYVIEAVSTANNQFSKFNYQPSGTPTYLEALYDYVPSTPIVDAASLTVVDAYKNEFVYPRLTKPVTGGPGRGGFSVIYTNTNDQPVGVLVPVSPIRLEGLDAFLWDGRDASGNIVADAKPGAPVLYGAGGHAFYRENSNRGLRLNSVVVQGTAVEIPGISIKSNPYRMNLSYGEFTTLKYSINKDALISITIKNPLTQNVFTILSDDPQSAGDQIFVWDGKNNTGKPVPNDGHYTFTITAVHPQTGLSASRRGNITVYK